MKKLKLVIFSDLHYAPELPVNNGSKIDRKLIQYSEQILEKLTSEINENIKPDLVVNLGDSIEDFNDKEKDLVNLKYIWNKYQDINTEFISCIGNHDLRSMDSRKEVEEIFGYSHSTFSRDVNGLHIVVLGTFVNNQAGTAEGGIFKTQYISNEDLEWLKKDLEKTTLPTIVCLHFGVAEDKMSGSFIIYGSEELYIHAEVYIAVPDELMDPALRNNTVYMAIGISVEVKQFEIQE